MRAYHRLAGDFPNRGYGNAIRTPGFPEDGPVINGPTPRLSTNTDFVRPQEAGASILEQTGAWELLQLSYGMPVVVRSGQLSRNVGRTHSYSDAVIADSTIDGAAVSIEELLLFNAFISPQVFWGLPKNTLSLPPDEWALDTPSVLKNADDAGRPLYTEPQGDDLDRLLIRYWHAASMQTFGPWADKEQTQFAYAQSKDEVMNSVMQQPTMLLGVISDQRHHEQLIRVGKAFLYRTLLSNLPPEVQGIASASVGVAGNSVSHFPKSAMHLMFPEENQKNLSFDLRSSSFPAARMEEMALMRLIRADGLDAVPFLKDMRDRCFASAPAEGARLASDWQVLLDLYRISTEQNTYALVRHWYRLYMLLMDRHMGNRPAGERGERSSELMREVDRAVLAKLDMSPAAIGADATLLSFFWRKVLFTPVGGHRAKGIAQLNACLQTPDNINFFLPRLIHITVNTPELAERAALTLKMTLEAYYADGSLSADHMKLLMDTEALTKFDALRQVMCGYIRNELTAYHQGERDNSPDPATDYCLYLMPMARQFMQTDRDVEELLRQVVSSRTQRLLTDSEAGFINSFLSMTSDKRASQSILCQYLVQAFQTQPPEALDRLLILALTFKIDPTETVTALLGQARTRLCPQQLEFILGLVRACPKGSQLTIDAAARVYAVQVLFADPQTPLSPAECALIDLPCQTAPSEVASAATAYYVGLFFARGEEKHEAALIAEQIRVGTAAAVQHLLVGQGNRLSPRQLESLYKMAAIEHTRDFSANVCTYVQNVLMNSPELLRPDERQFVAALAQQDGALFVYLSNIAQPYYLSCFQQYGATAQLGDMMAALKLDAAPTAVQLLEKGRQENRCYAPEALRMMMNTMPVNEEGRVAIRSAWKGYAQQYMDYAATHEPKDMQPWFEEGCTIFALVSVADQNWMANLLPDYVTTYCRQQGRVASASAFAVFSNLPAGNLRNRADELKQLYEHLLTFGTQEAVQQAEQLMPYLGNINTMGTPHLRKQALVMLRRALVTAWQTGSYWNSIDQVIRLLPESGLLPMNLYATEDAVFCNAAARKAEAEATRLTNPAEFAARYSMGLDNAAPFRAVWTDAISKAFIRSFDAMFRACRTYDDLQALLNALSDLNISTQSLPGSAYACADLMNKFRGLLLKHWREPAPQLSMAMRILQEGTSRLQSNHGFDEYYDVTHSLLSTLMASMTPARYTTRLLRACLTSIPRNHQLPVWNKVLDQLQPGWQNMLRKPFAAENLAMMQTVTVLISALNSHPGLHHWRDDLRNYLYNDPELSPYMTALVNDKRAASYLNSNMLNLLK